jgi:Ca2+-transporting ATPase
MEPAAPPARQVFARMDAQKACEMLQTDPQSGLTLVNVERSRDKNGPNQLESPPRRTFCDLLLPQLKDLLVVLLMLAALTAFIIALVTKAHFEEFVAPIFIVFIVIANAVLGVTQEGAADDAVAALDKKSVTKVEVLREGKKVSIDQVEVVVGDIIILGLGTCFPFVFFSFSQLSFRCDRLR